MSNNYGAFVERIEKATSVDDATKLEISLDRLYNAGVFSVAEFNRLDSHILKKTIAIEEASA